jgi:hypothetical protein
LFVFLLLLLLLMYCLVIWGRLTLRDNHLLIIIILKTKIYREICNFNLHKFKHNCWASDFLQIFWVVCRLLNTTKSTAQAIQH